MRSALVAVLAGLAGLIGWQVLAARKEKHSLSRLAATREAATSLSLYRASLPEVPDALRTDIYTLLQGLLPIQGFPIEPTDNLWTTYQLDQGTLESMIEDYLDAKGIAPPTGGSGIETVQDLVHMLHRQVELAGR